jgi:hypothetical protein
MSSGATCLVDRSLLCPLSPSLLTAAIDEVGGVPFLILEPVLERCTPDQLLRIEEYNPVRSGDVFFFFFVFLCF